MGPIMADYPQYGQTDLDLEWIDLTQAMHPSELSFDHLPFLQQGQAPNTCMYTLEGNSNPEKMAHEH